MNKTNTKISNPLPDRLPKPPIPWFSILFYTFYVFLFFLLIFLYIVHFYPNSFFGKIYNELKTQLTTPPNPNSTLPSSTKNQTQTRSTKKKNKKKTPSTPPPTNQIALDEAVDQYMLIQNQMNENLDKDTIVQKQYTGKKGYCYIGRDRGYRSCISVGLNDYCMSGDIFPTQAICINPSLRL